MQGGVLQNWHIGTCEYFDDRPWQRFIKPLPTSSGFAEVVVLFRVC